MIIARAKLFGAVLTVAALQAQVALTAPVEVPSCYTIVGGGLEAPARKRELFVVVDQTVKLDAGLRETANQKIQKFISPGDRVVIVSFSAFAKDRYSEIVLDAVLDQDVPEAKKFTTSKTLLARLTKCLKDQEAAVRNLAATSLNSVFESAATNLPNTELIGSLTMFSREIMAARKSSKQYVLIVSDMLEHSAVTSFYANNRVRRIEPSKEMERARANNMVGVFQNAEVYVHGAGFTDDGRYRSVIEMKAIEQFWAQWIKESGGILKGYGAPSLFAEIGN